MTKRIGNKPPLVESDYSFFDVGNLQCLYIKNSKVKKTYVSMAVDCGSNDDTIPGLAHLLEHLLFISPDQESSDQSENENTKVNDFDSFLNEYNGHSNAYTDDDTTVYHYELDASGTHQSLVLFSKFFKNPKIIEETIKTEAKVVDSEFQNGKNNDDRRVWRLLDIMQGKQFTTGNLNSFGSDYQKIICEAKKLYEKKYKKMILVVCSNLPEDEISAAIKKNFTHELEKVTYTNFECQYCVKNKEPNYEISINKTYKLKSILPRKRVLIHIPLISENKLPQNMYSSLMFFLTKNDHSSLIFQLKKQKLIINGEIFSDTNIKETQLILDFTVDDTSKYREILSEVKRQLSIFKGTQALVSEQSKIAEKVHWQLEEEEDPREHVVDCAGKLLRSYVLFTDLIHKHECPNLRLGMCNVILADDLFEIKEKKDEYELFYEEVEILDGKIEDKKDNFWKNIEKIHGENAEISNDEDIGTNLKALDYQNGKLMFIKDNFKTPKTVITIFLGFKAMVEDEIKLKLFVENIKLLYDSLFRLNGLDIECILNSDGIEFTVSGTEPLFLLVNILNGIQIDIIDQKTIIQDIKALKMVQRNKSGYLRVCNEISKVYKYQYQNIDEEFDAIEKIIQENSVFMDIQSFLKKTEKIILLVNGAINEESYYDLFIKFCDRIKENSQEKKIEIQEDFKKKIDLADLLEKKQLGSCTNLKLLSQKKVSAHVKINARNKASAFFFKIGDGPRNSAICMLLVHVLNEKFFTLLRTEKSLGYVVFVSHKRIINTNFIMFNVQSNENVLHEIISFIENANFEIGNKQVLKNSILAEKLSREEINEFYFRIIYSQNDIKNCRQRLCDFIDEIQEKDLREALRDGEMVLIESEAYDEIN